MNSEFKGNLLIKELTKRSDFTDYEGDGCGGSRAIKLHIRAERLRLQIQSVSSFPVKYQLVLT